MDGHLFKDFDGTEYLIYSNEWIQNGTVGIGEMWIQEISHDYTHLIGNATVLFQGGDADWSSIVIDGPSMFYYNDVYYLFWSSFDDNYGVGYAYSDNLLGPYVQSQKPIVPNDTNSKVYLNLMIPRR